MDKTMDHISDLHCIILMLLTYSRLSLSLLGSRMPSILFPIEPITFPLFSFAKERIDACLAASLSPYAQRKEHWIGWMDDDCEDHFWRQSAIIREATQWRLIFSWHWNEEHKSN